MKQGPRYRKRKCPRVCPGEQHSSCDHFGEHGARMPRKETIPGTALYPYGRHFIVVGFILEGNLTLLHHFLTLDVVMALELGTLVSLYAEKGHLSKV